MKYNSEIRFGHILLVAAITIVQCESASSQSRFTGPPKTYISLGQTHGLDYLAASKDGKVVLSASLSGEVVVWDGGIGIDVDRYSIAGSILALEISSDGTRFLTGHSDGRVRVWSTRSGKQMLDIDDCAAMPGTCIWSYPGDRIITLGRAKQTIHCVQLNNPSSIQTIALDSGLKATCVATNASGDKMAVACSANVFVYSTVSRRLEQVLQVGGSAITAIAFGRHCDLLALGTAKGDIEFVNKNNGQLVRRVECDHSPVQFVFFDDTDKCCIAFLRNGAASACFLSSIAPLSLIRDKKNRDLVFCISKSGAAVLWGVQNERQIKEYLINTKTSELCYLSSADQPIALKASDNLRQFVVGNSASGAVVWDAHYSRPSFHIPILAASKIEISGNGERILVAGDQQAKISLWDIHSAGELWSFSKPRNGICLFALDQQGTTGAIAEPSGNALLIVDLASRKELSRIPGPSNQWLRFLDYRPKAGRVLLGYDSTVKCWSIANNICEGMIDRKMSESGHLVGVGFSRNETAFVALYCYGLLCTANLGNDESYSQRITLPPNDWIPRCCFSNGGNVLLAPLGAGSRLSFFEMTRTRYLNKFLMPQAAACSFVCNSSGDRFMIPCESHISIWDSLRSQEIGRVYSFDSGADWIVLAKTGAYDCSPNGRKRIHISSSEIAHKRDIDLMDKWLVPRLLNRLLTGDSSEL